jgi:DNA-directed RNA polymerase
MNALTAHAEMRTIQKVRKVNERVVRTHGDGASIGARRITEANLQRLSSHIQMKLLERTKRPVEDESFLMVLRQMDPDVIALVVLQSALHSIAKEADLRAVYLHLGRGVADELWSRKLLQHDGKLAGKIDRAVRQRHGSVRYRKQAARGIAARAGFRMRNWSARQLSLAGSLLLDWLLEALPDVFAMVEAHNEFGRLFTLTNEAFDDACAAVDHALRAHPVYLPTTEPPVPWTGWQRGGYANGGRARDATLLRSRHRETEAEVKAAIRDGSMQPFLDALNALQAVPFTINKRVLDVMRACVEQGIPVPGLPSPSDLELPAPIPKAEWDVMEDGAQRIHKYKISKIKQGNRSLVADRLLLAEDMKTAELLGDHERFYTPMNADWRGRVYALPHFNFQRDDRIRSLFLFAEGVPMTEEGLYWLRVHVANCGDFGKISKRSFDERVQWTIDNAAMIQATAETPLAERQWHEADKPFLFLAACMEVTSALSATSTAGGGQTGYVTRLPVSFDGSCSGLQHLSAMTRAPEGALVNLGHTTEPQDVYQTVADRARARIEADLESEDNMYARMCLAYGIDRKLVKRNVMTFAYSSKKFGMSKQHMEDLMKPLSAEVLQGKYEEHPFGADEGYVAAKYLAGHTYDAICEVVKLPAEAMGFLQKCAKALAHEGKPLRWTTPTGLPWTNRYHVLDVKRIRLWLQDIPVRVSVVAGAKKEIDKEKSSNGVAPNFVHACDAAHLMLTANAAAREGIHIATVHDSFGCLAPHAPRFRDIIREEFVAMYEQHDVLAEVLERATCDLTPSNTQRLPEVPQYGSLDIRQVLDAPFAFA